MADPAIETGNFSTGEPGCHVRIWRPPAKPRGSVVVLHGIQSHGGWYGASCARLADAGYEVRLPDRRGSGLNPENRGDAPSLRVLLDDVAVIVRSAPPPRFLAGISWGGKLALAFDRRHPGLLNGVTLIAPGLCEAVGYSLLTRLRILAARFVHPSRRFPLPFTQSSLFTANPERQRFIDDDPLTLRKATARLLVESRRLDFYCRHAARHSRLPILLLLAERDRIIDNGRTRKLMQSLAPNRVEVREYAGAHHTLEFEPSGPPFVDHWIAWLNARDC